MLDNFPADTALLWIVLLPLAGAIANGLAGRFADRRLVSTVAVGSVVGAFALAVLSFIKLYSTRLALGEGQEANARIVYDVYEWFSIQVGNRTAPVSVRFVMDSLSGVMTLVVTGIGSLIHIYSLGYMSEEKSYARFFAYLNLFTASMLILVLASNLPLMFVGWEGVGLCSYLLIGFWYENPSYAAAGRKAFVVNRIGDFGVLIGMFLLVMVVGSFEFTSINMAAPELGGRPWYLGGPTGLTIATAACLFLFLGCAGKSAQIPLYVWLPDAMAGPTPVSALIHAATMVTAGVYLCCRLSPVFLESPVAMSVIAIVGSLTALMAATIAVVQREMKKILAYSTVSQLGFMFAAVGVGAFSAGFFHVFTHAFFKACLFLGAGSVMHSVGAHGDADIFKLGGMKKYMPATRITFLVSCLAIAGFPLTSGFFSKDEILLGASVLGFAEAPLGEFAGMSGYLNIVGWFVLGTLTVAATMTAFYMFRLYFLTFSGTYRSGAHEGEAHADGEHADDDHAHDGHAHDGHGHDDHGYDPHPHESPFSMTFPLWVLGGGALLVGFLGLPHAFHLWNWWGGWMDASVSHGPGLGPDDHFEDMLPVYVAMACGVGAMAIGILSAWTMYGKGTGADPVTDNMPKPLYRFLFDKWRVDEFYEATVLRVTRGSAFLIGVIDKRFVDFILTGASALAVRGGGWLFTRLQVGVVHAYAAVMTVGFGVVIWWFLYPHADVEFEVRGNQVTYVAQRGIGYEYRWDAQDDGEFETAWDAGRLDLTHSYSPAEYRGAALVIDATNAPGEAPREIELDDEPQTLHADWLDREWLASPDNEEPPAVWAEDGVIVVRPNGARVLRGGQDVAEEEVRLHPGEVIHIGRTPVFAAAIVEATLEIRNTFGNRTRETVDVIIRPNAPAPAATAQNLADTHEEAGR